MAPIRQIDRPDPDDFLPLGPPLPRGKQEPVEPKPPEEIRPGIYRDSNGKLHTRIPENDGAR